MATAAPWIQIAREPDVGPTLLGSPKRRAGTAASEGKFTSTPERTPFYAVKWAEAVRRYGSLDALIFDGTGAERRFSFEDLEADANRLARCLSGMGIGVGDRLVTIAENRPEMVVLLLSCLKLGVTMVPLATDLRLKDCHGMVARYQPSLVVCDQPRYAPFRREEGGDYQTIWLPPFEGHDNQLKQMMAEGSGAPIPMPDVPADVPSMIFSTSGSTALPKGVMYSHADLAGLADLAADFAMAPEERTKHLMWVSMRGVGGTLFLLKQMLQGATAIMVDTYPSGPKLWGELIAKHNIDTHMLFGAAMNQTLQELPGRKFESVRTLLYGGSCFAPTLIQQSMEQFPNAAFCQVYGMTEVSPITMMPSAFHKRAGYASQEDLLRMTSAGKVLVPGNVFIEDLEQPGSGKPPPAEKDGVGQVCARSTITMMGYYANLEKTDEAMPDGKFVRTGDVGRIDQNGILYILGRVKDIIPAYRGFNVAPRDIEEVLYSHPDVGQASVVGVWHPSGAGEAVVAWARAKAGAKLCAEGLRRHCEESGMPQWQMPDGIHVSLEPLPTTGGKIDAKALRAPTFRQAQLAADLATARARSESGIPAPSEHAGRSASEDALVTELCEAGCDLLCESKLATAFGDALQVALAALSSGASGTSTGRVDLLVLLKRMSDEEYETFQLGVRSLLGNWATGKLA